MSGAPLYELLRRLEPGGRFHTPGHKGRLGGIFSGIAGYDITETAKSDELYHPTGAILEAEELAAEYFGTELTLFSAGGATLCIQTAMTLFRGRKVLIERNSHVSVFNAAALLGVEPVYIYNKTDALPREIFPEQVEAALKENPDAAAVFLTSPNYYGRTADLKSIKKICRKHGVLVCVDNSHGTHLFALDREGCPQGNSDICIDSAHKTLPVLTGGAYLHFNIKADRLSLKNAMGLFGSTSPSFPILASLDYARAWLREEGEEKLRLTAAKTEGLKKSLPFEVEPSEPLRITVAAKNSGELARLMLEKGIIYEMATASAVVLLISPFNDEGDFKLLRDFFTETEFLPERPDPAVGIGLNQRAMPYIQAMLSDCEWVDAAQAAGRIAAGNVLPYPPGIPLLLAGERISDLRGISGQIKVIKEV